VLRIWRRVRRALRNCGRFSPNHYVGRRCASHEFDKQHVKCVVHPIPNDDRIADSDRAAFVFSQGRLPLDVLVSSSVPPVTCGRLARGVWPSVPMLAYELMLQKLENRVSNSNVTPLKVSFVGK
jgi:hypothetical protein